MDLLFEIKKAGMSNFHGNFQLFCLWGDWMLHQGTAYLKLLFVRFCGCL